jgi:hypothetical protein
MTNEQEIKAKALEIAALILGVTDKDPLPHGEIMPVPGDKPADIIAPYLLVAEEVEKRIRQAPAFQR